MDNAIIRFSGLEIFFIVTTVISLVLNLLQWKDRRAFRIPLTNSLVALFNDIKVKSNNATFVYGSIFGPNNPHGQLETIRWEYGLFVQTAIGYLQGFQETVVGLLISLNPKDTHGKLVFRSTDYGLTKEENEYRREMWRKWRAQSSEVHPERGLSEAKKPVDSG